jgi:hypothetical protein
MLGRSLFRAITAADATTLAVQMNVYPRVSGLQVILTAIHRGHHLANAIEMHTNSMTWASTATNALG